MFKWLKSKLFRNKQPVKLFVGGLPKFDSDEWRKQCNERLKDDEWVKRHCAEIGDLD